MDKTYQNIALSQATMKTIDDNLVERARQDPMAFADLYDRHLPRVYRYLYTKVSDPAEVEDLTSQVFLAALEAFPHYRHKGYFRAWLLAIARHKAADYYRNHIPLTSLDQVSDVPSPAQNPLTQLVKDDELQRLACLIACLREDERELLRLRFAARLSFAEIAQFFKRKESAVKMTLYRLLEKLEKQFEVKDE